MLLRVVTSTVLIGLGSVAVLGTYVVFQIRDGLVEAKVDRVLVQAASDAREAQVRMDSTTAVTPGALQKLVNDLITTLNASGGGDRGVLLLQQPGNTAGIVLTTGQSAEELVDAVTPQMRAAVQAGAQTQLWQHARIGSEGQPAVVVGTPLRIPVAGEYELYFVYSLAGEQGTLDLIERVLAIGGLVLVALVVFMTWSVTLQTVRPVRQAARVASRLADGLLGERMVIQGHDEMATLATTFNEMAESLQRQITRMEELSRLQRRFVSDVSHELRTPLTTVRMASDVLHDARASFSPEAARSAELLNAQLDRFEALLADLLEISRIDAGAAHLEIEDLDIQGVVKDEIDAMAHVASGASVDIRLWAQPGPHVAAADRPRVARIVRNLLSNAIEYAQGGPVDVLVGSSKRGVAVMVRDYGLGMTAAEAERVFDRFWRADSSRRRTMGGTGLGLSISREDALLHGGRLEAWGSPGHGASFRLSLPRSSDGLGTRPVIPLVARESEFARLGERVPLGPAAPVVEA